MNANHPVLQPISKAQGLSNHHYISDTTFQTEAQEIFAAGWAAIGFTHDVPSPGCVYPLDFMGTPLLIARNAQGEINVFENVCRHRGMILVDEPKKLSGPITCPYHAWAYDFDGQLRATPHVGGPGIHHHEEVVCEELSLHTVRTAIWREVIFVNLSGNAAPFERAAQSLRSRWQEFEQPLHFAGADSEFTLNLNCNWKLAVENYCEAYHLPFIHPDLNSYSRLEDHYNILDDAGFAGQGSEVYNPQIAPDGRQFPIHQGLAEKWDTASEYCAFFPNVLFGVHKDHSFAIILHPLSPHQTTERCAIYYAQADALEQGYSDMRTTNTAMWKKVFIEDIGVVEGMQKGRNAPHFDGGKFSPVMDSPTHHFHKWVASSLHR